MTASSPAASYADLVAAEHAGALEIWRATMRGVHWRDLEENEAAQFALRDAMRDPPGRSGSSSDR